MKKKDAVLAAVVICLSAGVAWAADTTSLTMTSKGAKGGQQGPWTISAGGNVSLDSSVIGWSGLQYSVTDTNNKTTWGFTNLPNGGPKQRGAAVPWTGSVGGLTVASNYSIVCTMSYVDSGMQPQKMSAQSNITVP